MKNNTLHALDLILAMIFIVCKISVLRFHKHKILALKCLHALNLLMRMFLLQFCTMSVPLPEKKNICQVIFSRITARGPGKSGS